VYQGRVNSPINFAIVTPPPDFESSVKWPCAPLDQGDGENLPMSPTEVTVRVLNGTDEQGLARNTLEVLTGRGYVPAASGAATNWNRTYSETVRIQFGEEGLRQAYTVAANFPEYEMVLDNRDGAVVDIILGDLFETKDIRPQYAAELDSTVELTAPVQCLPIALVPKEPAPRIIPVDPLAPIVTPSPSVTPSVTPEA
jgi:hypothetical protein